MVEQQATREERQTAEELRASKIYRRMGLDHASNHRARVPVVVAARVARTWGLWRPVQQIRLEAYETRVKPVLAAGWVTTLVLGALALPAAWSGRRRPTLHPMVGLLVMVTLVSAVTYGNQRFRVAAEPVVIVLAASTIASWRSPSEGR